MAIAEWVHTSGVPYDHMIGPYVQLKCLVAMTAVAADGSRHDYSVGDHVWGYRVWHKDPGGGNPDYSWWTDAGFSSGWDVPNNYFAEVPIFDPSHIDELWP